MRAPLLLVLLSSLAGCAGAPPPAPAPVAAATIPPAPPPPPPAVDDWRFSQPKPGQPAPLDYPEVQTGKLDNGLSLYVVRRPVGIVSLSLIAKSGGSSVPAGKSGLAGLTVRMMTEGTTAHSPLALAEAAEALGASIEESAGRDFVRLGITTLKDDMRRGLALLAEVATKPSFAPKELERVRREWLDGIEGERQNPSRLASLVGLRLLLGPVAGAPVNGSQHDVTALSRDDLVRFHKENFVPENLDLIVVGDVALDDVRPLAKDLLGRMQGLAPAVVPAPLPSEPTGGKVVIVDRPGSVQTALFIGQRFPKRSEPGYETRELMNDVVGGLFTSRLNANLREKHAYTYGVRSVDIATRDWGAFAVMTSVRTDTTDDALHEAFAELDGARDPKLGRPFSDDELNTGRADLKQSLGASLADAGEIADRVENLFIEGLAPDYYRKYPAMLDSADTAAIAKESARIAPNQSVVVVVGDRASIEPKLKARALTVVPAEESLLD